MSMNNNDMAKFRELFLQTASAYIEEIKSNFLEYLEDKSNMTVVENIFVASHSLAGQSSMMGYVGIASFASVVENIFRAKKNQNREVTDEEINLIKSALEKVNQSLVRIKDGDDEIKITDEISRLRDIVGIQ